MAESDEVTGKITEAEYDETESLITYTAEYSDGTMIEGKVPPNVLGQNTVLSEDVMREMERQLVGLPVSALPEDLERGHLDDYSLGFQPVLD